MATIEYLPFEVLAYLLSFLPGSDLLQVSRVCKRFFSAIEVESVWQRRCKEEYGIDKTESDAISFKDLYSKLLYTYGWALGLWCKREDEHDHFGGVVHVQFRGGCLEGYQLLPPEMNQINDALQPSHLFTIRPLKTHERDCLPTGKQVEAVCRLKNSTQQHECKLKQTGCDSIWWKCSSPEIHQNRGDLNMLQEFANWALKETHGNPAQYFHHLLMSRFKHTVWPPSNVELHLTRLVLPPRDPHAIIHPGLFLGNYGAHGVEIMLLTYTDEGKTAEVKKVTGDPNVPAYKVSIRADVSRPMVLTDEQQETIAMLEDIDIGELPPGTPLDQLPQQRFCVPSDCSDRDGNPPNVCKARFHSKGHVAGHNYHEPSYIPGHWIVFNENTFGHIWLEIRSLGMFSRVKQNLDRYTDCDFGHQ